MTGSELRRKYIDFFKGKGHAEISGQVPDPRERPDGALHHRGHAPAGALHPRRAAPGGQAPGGLPEVRPHRRHRRGRATRRTSPSSRCWATGRWATTSRKTPSPSATSSSPRRSGSGFSPELLSVTVFAGDEEVPPDDEAAEVWKSVGIPESRIHFLGRKDNWWGPAGQTGPCGPDTEMFIDTLQPACGPDCKPGCHCGKYIEIWNDVFMQYNKTAEGSLPCRSRRRRWTRAWAWTARSPCSRARRACSRPSCSGR